MPIKTAYLIYRVCCFFFYPMEYVIRKQTSENRYQKSENRKQVSESRYQRTDIRRQKTANRNQTPENRNHKSEIRTQRTDNRNQRTEIRKRETENGNQISRLWAVICLRVSDPRLPAVFLFPQTGAFRNMLGNDPLCVFCPCIER